MMSGPHSGEEQRLAQPGQNKPGLHHRQNPQMWWNLYRGGRGRSTSLNKGFLIGSAIDFEEKFGIICLLSFFSL